MPARASAATITRWESAWVVFFVTKTKSSKQSYRYIKNLNTGDWLSFNDETARSLDAETLRHVLSEAPASKDDSSSEPAAKANPDDKSKLVRSSTNAYMLMY